MRKQFESLRQAVAAGEVDAVIVYSASSLSRDRSELLALLKEFDAHDRGGPFREKSTRHAKTGDEPPLANGKHSDQVRAVPGWTRRLERGEESG